MKLSCLSSATRPGDKAYNEDALLLNDAFCGIFDGATGLTNSAPVMSNYPRAYLKTKIAQKVIICYTKNR